MRKWMRERGKRRKSTENTSESTGKIGQAIDQSKPAPLVPSYDSGAVHAHREESEVEDEVQAKPSRRNPRAEESGSHPHGGRSHANRSDRGRSERSDGSEAGRMEVETQPDSPSTPSEVGDVMRRPPAGK